MNDHLSVHAMNSGSDDRSSSGSPRQSGRNLTRLAAWVSDRHLPFLVISIGMIVMLLWAGAFKMTVPGAEGIVPLVSNSPLIWWHFKIFGPYIGSDIIGSTEWLAAILFIVGYWRPKAGMVGGMITVLMFSTTSSMLLSTPGTLITVHGMRYMNNLGLFLYKDVIALGASLYLFSYFGHRALLEENRS
ncbi:YkgB family protein [Acidicapsa acidisoli]|uniref:YkgB family protein n=1 Tax=Acidicapsa acidisoli TaxID=1615681 RepID=UPI0021DFFB25|nr:YkgB family protein [Acidicapsa acidisoli]